MKSLLAGMSFPLWRGLRSSEGFALHKEVLLIFAINSNFQRFSSKIQQLKESGLITLWIQQEQDLVAQRAEEGLDHQYLASNQKSIQTGSSRGGISPLSLDNMQPVFAVGYIYTPEPSFILNFYSSSIIGIKK